MASAVRNDRGRWLARWKDVSGRWRKRASAINTKAAATELAVELEFQVRRQRAGLEPLPAKDGGGTLGELLTWWLETYSRGTASHERTEYSVRKHLLRSELASVRLQEFASGDLERFLQAKVADYSAQTINHLRRFVLTAFNCGRRAGRWMGPNPASDVRQRKVHRRAFDYLRATEVPRVLAALHPRWRPMFAAAVYTGLRRSELRALRKGYVDLEAGLLTVARSGERDTTKGGHADTIPIATELVPYLSEALECSPSALVFPHVCVRGCAGARRCPGPGGLMRPDVPLENVLRRALARAGIAEGYRHVCRRKGCGEAVEAPDNGMRRCSVHGAKL